MRDDESMERRLEQWYPAHRSSLLRDLLRRLQRASLASFQGEEASVLLRIAPILDGLVEAMVEHSPDTYLAVQRVEFEHRLAAGARIEDLLAAIGATQMVAQSLVNAAFADSPSLREPMSMRAQRYLTMTHATLINVLLEHQRTEPARPMAARSATVPPRRTLRMGLGD